VLEQEALVWRVPLLLGVVLQLATHSGGKRYAGESCLMIFATLARISMAAMERQTPKLHRLGHLPFTAGKRRAVTTSSYQFNNAQKLTQTSSGEAIPRVSGLTLSLFLQVH
jgi:hypothetical protein